MQTSRSLSPRRRYPLYVVMSGLFSVLVLAAGASVAWIGYLQGRNLAVTAADEVFMRIGRETKSSLSEIMQPARSFAELLALQPTQPIAQAHTLASRLEALPLLVGMLTDSGFISSIYLGYDDGGFFLVRPLRDATRRPEFSAPPEAAFMVESIEIDKRGKKQISYLFFDGQLHEIGRQRASEFPYDPRNRPWYGIATEPGKRVLTAPYVFATSGEWGLTVAVRTGSGSVVGIDATLSGMSERLSMLRTLPGMKIALFDNEHHLLAHAGASPERETADGERFSLATVESFGDPVIAAMQTVTQDNADTLAVGGRDWKTVVLPLPSIRGPMFLGIAVPLDDLLSEARSLRDHGLLAAAAVLLLALPLTWLTAHRVARILRDIAGEAENIRAFRFDGPGAGPSVVREVDQLSQAMTMMRGTIRHFLDIAASLAAESNFERLLERVVRETSSASGAAGGLLYLTNGDGRKLVPASLVRADEHKLDIALPEQDIDGDSPVAEAFRSGRTVSTRIRAPYQGLKSLWELLPGMEIDVVVIPLRDRDRDTVGTLVLFSSVGEPLNGSRLAFAEALSSTAAVAIETQRLMEARKALLDAFIRLVAGAIDAKSPYTGGHCQRVPELTAMLAQAACGATDGAFKDFCLSEAQWETLQIASWLHDCGKVTTPEYVVDKATKLETLYDRIHEVRMRFEVLKRDAQIDYWKAVASGADAALLEPRLKAGLAALDEDFAFVASCNEGGESMDPERIARLQTIAGRTWLRTLDDRIGISSEEKARKDRGPVPSLPVVERLLDDKSEHAIERADADRMPEDNPWGFRLQVPELKYNRGELYNLLVGRGTLNEEERYVINHHIVQTIIMLSQLPFPKHLKDVPAVAGGHHEKMDGSGYPKRLTREEMSMSARMMAIADIFEALTAVDRPYKKGKTLSEAIHIMHAMKREQHIDPDLFDLFLTSGVYRRYAERFLQTEQIDEVDIGRYIGKVDRRQK